MEGEFRGACLDDNVEKEDSLEDALRCFLPDFCEFFNFNLENLESMSFEAIKYFIVNEYEKVISDSSILVLSTRIESCLAVFDGFEFEGKGLFELLSFESVLVANADLIKTCSPNNLKFFVARFSEYIDFSEEVEAAYVLFFNDIEGNFSSSLLSIEIEKYGRKDLFEKVLLRDDFKGRVQDEALFLIYHGRYHDFLGIKDCLSGLFDFDDIVDSSREAIEKNVFARLKNDSSKAVNKRAWLISAEEVYGGPVFDYKDLIPDFIASGRIGALFQHYDLFAKSAGRVGCFYAYILAFCDDIEYEFFDDDSLKALYSGFSSEEFLYSRLPFYTDFLEVNGLSEDDFFCYIGRVFPLVNLMIFNNKGALDLFLENKIKRLILSEHDAFYDDDLPTVGVEFESLRLDSFKLLPILNILNVSAEEDRASELEVNASFSYSGDVQGQLLRELYKLELSHNFEKFEQADDKLFSCHLNVQIPDEVVRLLDGFDLLDSKATKILLSIISFAYVSESRSRYLLNNYNALLQQKSSLSTGKNKSNQLLEFRTLSVDGISFSKFINKFQILMEGFFLYVRFNSLEGGSSSDMGEYELSLVDFFSDFLKNSRGILFKNKVRLLDSFYVEDKIEELERMSRNSDFQSSCRSVVDVYVKQVKLFKKCRSGGLV